MLSKIKSIKKLNIKTTRYNLEIQDNHNYFANNILVHNCRCLTLITNDEIIPYSRQLKKWTSLSHIVDEIVKLNLPVGTILDGELYIHGEEFQNLTSAIKRDSPSDKTKSIQYHIYDCVSNNDFKNRYEWLQQNIKDSNILKLVQCQTISTQTEIEAKLQKYLDAGYEGMMLRNIKGPYKSGGRSFDLQKVKKFIDMEFPITGAYQNKGKMKNQCTFECATDDGTIFGVKPMGSEQMREQYWANWQDGTIQPGDLLTVRFFAWTTSQHPVPRFPVGVAIRNYEG
jgi:ATP-dependent DNA ligase